MKPTRRKTPNAPACESLEGRRLLTAGADLRMAPGMFPMGGNGPADVSNTPGLADSSGHFAAHAGRSDPKAGGQATAPDAARSGFPGGGSQRDDSGMPGMSGMSQGGYGMPRDARLGRLRGRTPRPPARAGRLRGSGLDVLGPGRDLDRHPHPVASRPG